VSRPSLLHLVVEVLAAQVGVTGSRLDFEHALLQAGGRERGQEIEIEIERGREGEGERERERERESGYV
jgi:hypothetical protein